MGRIVCLLFNCVKTASYREWCLTAHIRAKQKRVCIDSLLFLCAGESYLSFESDLVLRVGDDSLRAILH